MVSISLVLDSSAENLLPLRVPASITLDLPVMQDEGQDESTADIKF